MAEKRTKPDKLQRSIERTERRIGARSEETVAEAKQDTEPVATIAESSQLEEEIRRRAYEHYEARGRKDGHDLDDWLQARAEIIHSKRKSAAA